MRLTQFADYGLRVLMYLGCHADQRATTAEIATAYGISQAHLQKIVRALGAQGFLRLHRGRSGGLELERAPADISLGKVVRGLEGSASLVECFDPERDQCVISPVCGLKAPLERALEAFYRELDSVTLEDVLDGRNRKLRALLHG